MRIPPLSQFSGWTKAAGIFIAGMIVGASVFMAAVQNVVNEYLSRNQQMELEMRMMQENARTHTADQTVISYIDVFLDPDENSELSPVTATRLRFLISEDLSVLKGKRVYHVAPRMDGGVRVLRTLFKKVYQDVDGKDYIVEINNYIVMYGNLTVWASVREYRPGLQG